MRPTELKLEPITNANWRNALQVRTTPAQRKFVSDYEPVALVILSKSYVRSGDVDWHPFTIMMDDTIVGVVAITHHAKRCEIFHLAVDSRQQGRGLGKTVVKLLVEHIRATWPEVEVVALTVHPKNAVAQHVYKSCGFVGTGAFQDSEPVLEFVL